MRKPAFTSLHRIVAGYAISITVGLGLSEIGGWCSEAGMGRLNQVAIGRRTVRLVAEALKVVVATSRIRQTCNVGSLAAIF